MPVVPESIGVRLLGGAPNYQVPLRKWSSTILWARREAEPLFQVTGRQISLPGRLSVYCFQKWPIERQ
jgi:hypothetical protein